VLGGVRVREASIQRVREIAYRDYTDEDWATRTVLMANGVPTHDTRLRAPVQRRDRYQPARPAGVGRDDRERRIIARYEAEEAYRWYDDEINNYVIDVGRRAYQQPITAQYIPAHTHATTTTTTGWTPVNVHWNQGTGATGIRYYYEAATQPYTINYATNTITWNQITVEDPEVAWRRALWQVWNGPYIARREDRLATADTIWTGWVRNTNTGERVEMNMAIPDVVWARWDGDFEEHIRQRMREEFERHMRAGTRPQWEMTDEQREAIERAEQERRDREQAERERINRERLAREQEFQRLRQEAKDRALELLMMVLTPEERLQHENMGEIFVRGSDGHLYQLQTTSRNTVHGNIVRTDEHGCKLGTVCVAPAMHESHEEGRRALPIEDGWVGQYLGLRHNAEEFLRHGNWSYVRECQHKDTPTLRTPAQIAAGPVNPQVPVEERNGLRRLAERIGIGAA